jgi:hypothetical protein
MVIIGPLIAAGGPIHFFLDEKVNKKSPLRLMLSKVLRRPGVVIAAPANAEQRLGRVCEWTICGGIKFDFFIKFFKI